MYLSIEQLPVSTVHTYQFILGIGILNVSNSYAHNPEVSKQTTSIHFKES